MFGTALALALVSSLALMLGLGRGIAAESGGPGGDARA